MTVGRPEEERSNAYKDLGNAAYKKKQFDDAIRLYNRALEADANNLTCLTNLAAVKYEKGDLDGAAADSELAISRCREIHGDYKVLARAMERLGTIEQKRGNLAGAVKHFEAAQMEFRSEGVEKKIKEVKAAIKLAEEASLLNDDEAAKFKEIGNTAVKEGRIPDAIQAYTDSIKRNPKDHTVFTNRALCYTKMMCPVEAVRDCEKALAIKPDFGGRCGAPVLS